MGWFAVNYSIISAAVGILVGIGTLWASLKSSFSGTKRFSKVDRLYILIKNLQKLNANEKRIAKNIEEYERLVFNKIHRTRLSYINQKRILKFYNKHEKALDWNTITSASIYFDFSSKKITVKIPFSAWFMYGYFIVICALLATLAIGGLLLPSEDFSAGKQLGVIGIVVISFAALLYSISRFIAPVNMARRIKKYLAHS